MLIKHHRQAVETPLAQRAMVRAATTPTIRAAIQASDAPAWVVAEWHGILAQTVWKWRKRDGFDGCSHRPHRLQIETDQQRIQ